MLPIDPAGMYRTELAKAVKLSRRWYYPGQHIIFSGPTLQGIIDGDPAAVSFYEQVPWPAVPATEA